MGTEVTKRHNLGKNDPASDHEKTGEEVRGYS